MNANTRRQLRATVRRRQEARAATVRAVLLARDQGATLREIGELVELSTSQVDRIIRRGRIEAEVRASHDASRT